ncbi:hypothetical protein F53441_8709 [Fusarium austroafricanum]|uniref:Prion-inhibition and propagation HeLo domain-containing protein n=1 Tax=Fusarium austroafricanum TaxID=2364996 RepID=A0A8H4KAS4_9HYPO|nr:hypothetical protein F53441_8709 [Fusarium austroafricanum]
MLEQLKPFDPFNSSAPHGQSVTSASFDKTTSSKPFEETVILLADDGTFDLSVPLPSPVLSPSGIEVLDPPCTSGERLERAVTMPSEAPRLGQQDSAPFNNAVDCFEYIQLRHSFGTDYQTCQLNLDITRLRLSCWGEAVEINYGSRFTEVNSSNN